jgi:hypothetical protein
MFGSDVSENITLDMQVGSVHGTRPAHTCLTMVGVRRAKGNVWLLAARLHAVHELEPQCAEVNWVVCRTLVAVVLQEASPYSPPTVISMWLVIINPIAKLALTLAPVAMAVEVRARQPVSLRGHQTLNACSARLLVLQE